MMWCITSLRGDAGGDGRGREDEYVVPVANLRLRALQSGYPV
jgi:hypothetical protein